MKRTDEQRRVARERMRVYLADPINKQMHCNYSNEYYHQTLRQCSVRTTKWRKQINAASKKYYANNKLAMCLYQAMKTEMKKDNRWDNYES